MKDQSRIRILIVDDHPLLREGLIALIKRQPDMLVQAEADSGTDAIERCRDSLADVILLDLRLGEMSGVNVLISIRSEFPAARVVIYTTFEGDAEIQRALKAGARGYALKRMPPRTLLEVIRQVHAGKVFVPPEVSAQLIEHMGDDSLTPREVEVLRRVASGNRNREIGKLLFISEDTVKGHLKHIMDKLGARDRTHAIAIAVRRGIIEL